MKASEILCGSYDFTPFIMGQEKISFKQFQEDVQKYCADISDKFLNNDSVIENNTIDDLKRVFEE